MLWFKINRLFLEGLFEVIVSSISIRLSSIFGSSNSLLQKLSLWRLCFTLNEKRLKFSNNKCVCIFFFNYIPLHFVFVENSSIIYKLYFKIISFGLRCRAYTYCKYFNSIIICPTKPQIFIFLMLQKFQFLVSLLYEIFNTLYWVC